MATTKDIDQILVDMVVAFMYQNRQMTPPNYIGFNMLINPATNKAWSTDEMINALNPIIAKYGKSIESDKGDGGLPPSNQFPYFNTQLTLSEDDIKAIIDMNLSENMNINSFNMPRRELLLKQGARYQADTKKFQEIVKKYIKSINPKHQLYVLNRIQSSTPFMLMNPAKLLPPRIARQIKYGYADLLRFLCNPVFNEDVARFNEVGQNINMHTVKKVPEGIEMGTNKYKGNPFYNPIWYPIPDNRSNILIDDLMSRNKAFYESKIRQIQQLFFEVNNTRMDESAAIKRLNQILHLMVDIYDRENNPVYLSKDPVLVDKPDLYEYANFKNERPMETYNREHMMDTIYMLLSNKRAAPQTYDNKPMRNTGINLVERNKSRKTAF